MQIRAGTVTVTPTSERVISTQNLSDDSWSTIEEGAILVVNGEPTPYFIASLISFSISMSGFWEILLSAPYSGVSTGAGIPYTIVNDFTARLDLPLMHRGDAEGSVIYSRAMAIVDALVVLDPPVTVELSPHTFAINADETYLIVCDFHLVGTYISNVFNLFVDSNVSGTIITQEVSQATTGKVAFILFVNNATYYETVVNITLTPKVIGYGWSLPGTTTGITSSYTIASIQNLAFVQKAAPGSDLLMAEGNKFCLYNPDQSKYQHFTIKGTAGAETWSISDP